MSDILLQALMGANSQEEYENPWLRGAAGIQQQQQHHAAYDMKPWQRILVGALGGLGQGVSTGIGKRQLEDSANLRNQNIMGGMRSGKLMEAITADPYLAKYAPMIQIDQAQKGTDRLHELNKALYPKGLMLSKEGEKPTRFFDPVEDEIRQAGGIERAKLKAKSDLMGGDTWNGLEPKDIADLESKYTATLTSGPVAQKVMEIQTRGEQVLNAIKTRDPLHAATAIYGMAKVLDPEGVVRKEDGTIVANPGGPAGRLESIYNDLVQKGQLTDKTVASMEKLVPELVKGTYKSYAAQRDSIIGAAEKQGAKRDRIGFIPEPDFSAFAPAPTIDREALLAEIARRGLKVAQ